MSIGLNIGLRALLTSQTALETIGHNVANANTPGYSRQALDLRPAESLQRNNLLFGTGVRVTGIARRVDELLNRRMLQQIASLGRLNVREQSLGQIETLFGSGGENSISGSLEKFFSSIADLSAGPEDLVLRTGLVQSGLQLTDQLRSMGKNLTLERSAVASATRDHIGQVNELAGQLADLNRDILAAESSGQAANDLRDRRDEALRKLSDLIDVRVSHNDVGAVRVLAAGGLLVHPTGHNQLEVVDANGVLSIRIENASNPLANVGGRVGGLLHQANDYLPGLRSSLDDLTRNLVLEVNRRHSTGVPANGPMRVAVSANPIFDQNGNGQPEKQLLAQSGLPFDITDGALTVNVTSQASGAVETARIVIDPERTTVTDLLDQLSAITNLAASIDGQGHIRIAAADGYGFDFSRLLDLDPASQGTFGGAQASLGTGLEGPFGLAVGDTLQVQGPFGTANVTFAAADFQQIVGATAQELAAALSADPSFQASGLAATAVGQQLFLQTQAAGTTAALTVTGGSALAALGLAAGATASGHGQATTVKIGGTYSGADNDTYHFRATSDGIIGTTPGLQVEVRNSQQQVVGILDVGAGYVPGDELSVAQGVTVEFGFGELSATHGDRFDLDVTADSDTSDVLVALGLNSFFSGSSLADIDLRADLQRDPSLIASSSTGSAGDGGVLLELLALQQLGLESFSGQSLSGRLGGVVSATGLELSSVRNAREAEEFLLDGLRSRHDELTGVNVDEELVSLIEFEQAFQAASRYLSVIRDIGQELMSLV